MKRLLLFTALLCATLPASAIGSAAPATVLGAASETAFMPVLGAALETASADRAAELIARLSASFREMKGYMVSFTVASGDYTARGSYSVEGERYCLSLNDAEVFSDGSVRYEVDNRRREVTLVSVDRTSRNILNNPAHAFDFLDSEYAFSLLWERDGKAALRLTPAGKNASGTITLTLSTSPLRPLSLSYDYDGEQVDITVDSVTLLTPPIPAFDKAKYADYEQIDFR